MRLRILITLSLLFLGALVAVSGVILYFAPAGKAGGVPIVPKKRQLISVHSYSGFIVIGLAIIHLILNRRPLIAYLKRIFKG